MGTEHYGGGGIPDATEALVLELQDERDLVGRNRVADCPRRLLDKPSRPLVLDPASVPPARLEAVLTRCLKDASRE